MLFDFLHRFLCSWTRRICGKRKQADAVEVRAFLCKQQRLVLGYKRHFYVHLENIFSYAMEIIWLPWDNVLGEKMHDRNVWFTPGATSGPVIEDSSWPLQSVTALLMKSLANKDHVSNCFKLVMFPFS